MCRQYNDYGSIARDRAERNLDSINFSEFGASGGEVGVDVDERLKEELLWIAEYERECLRWVVRRLEVVGGRVRRRWEFLLGLRICMGRFMWLGILRVG